ncbi:MAG TPA: hypothetical protein PKO15_11970 [Fibrobacteria bacterium]|nr:hypothetical protein [Fibrobacteria bacterium]
MQEFVWVFLGNGAANCGGVFSILADAERWIVKHKLSGVLTKYPLGMGVWEWAQTMKYFTPKNERHYAPNFIGGFTSASMEHFHYQEGCRIDS